MEKNKKENLIKRLIQLIQALILLLQKQLLAMKKEKGFDEFALALRKRESSNRYQVVSAYGYLGAYQFGMARLCDLGYTERKSGTTDYANSSFQWRAGYSEKYFLNNPYLQDRIFKEHITDLIKQIESRYSDYIGKSFNGIKITLSGLVAGAHLGGVVGVGNFLRGYYNSHDQFGTSISGYIKQFAGYNLKVG